MGISWGIKYCIYIYVLHYSGKAAPAKDATLGVIIIAIQEHIRFVVFIWKERMKHKTDAHINSYQHGCNPRIWKTESYAEEMILSSSNLCIPRKMLWDSLLRAALATEDAGSALLRNGWFSCSPTSVVLPILTRPCCFSLRSSSFMANIAMLGVRVISVKQLDTRERSSWWAAPLLYDTVLAAASVARTLPRWIQVSSVGVQQDVGWGRSGAVISKCQVTLVHILFPPESVGRFHPHQKLRLKYCAHIQLLDLSTLSTLPSSSLLSSVTTSQDVTWMSLAMMMAFPVYELYSRGTPYSWRLNTPGNLSRQYLIIWNGSTKAIVELAFSAKPPGRRLAVPMKIG